MAIINNLNGERNFEKLVTYTALLLQQNMNYTGLNIYKEYYGVITPVNLPAINIFLKSVDPVRYDANTSVNDCVVSIVVYTDADDSGSGNSAKAKTENLKIIGQINNIFSKRVAYSMLTGHAIQQMRAGSVRFSTPADLKTDVMVLGEQQISITVNETNDEIFTQILQETHSQLNGDLDIDVPIVLSGTV